MVPVVKVVHSKSGLATRYMIKIVNVGRVRQTMAAIHADTRVCRIRASDTGIECTCGSGIALDGGESSNDDGGEGYGSDGETTLRFGIEIVGAEGGVTLICKFGCV